MQPGDRIPKAPEWFAGELFALFALYPNATASKATVPAWWRELHQLPPAAIIEGFKRASDESPTFVPTGKVVRAHAQAAAKSGFGAPRGNLSTPALPAHEEHRELPDDHPIKAEVDRIEQAVRSGEMRGDEVLHAVARAITGIR
jgi:hypothetical protein